MDLSLIRSKKMTKFPNYIKPELFETRYGRIREYLQAQNIGALLAYSTPPEHKWGLTGHVSYLSGWANHDRISDTFVVVPAEGEVCLLFAGLPYMLEQIKEISPIKDLRMVKAVDPNAVAVDTKSKTNISTIKSFAEEILSILDENKLNNKKIAVVGTNNMSIFIYNHLKESLKEQFHIPDKDIVAELRSVKSPEEIQMIKHAAHLGDVGFETLQSLARPGIHGIELVAEMEKSVRQLGADHAKYWMSSGPPTTWEACNLDIKPHLRILKSGDFINVCSYIVYRGYWSHGMRIGVLNGDIPKYHKNIFNIAKNAQDAGLNIIKAGIPVGNIAKAIRENATQHNWSLMGGRVGHGCGLDYSEKPIPAESNRDLLQTNNTIIVHSAFSLPNSGKMFVPLGDQFQVTQSGIEFLMGFPREIVQLGN